MFYSDGFCMKTIQDKRKVFKLFVNIYLIYWQKWANAGPSTLTVKQYRLLLNSTVTVPTHIDENDPVALVSIADKM